MRSRTTCQFPVVSRLLVRRSQLGTTDSGTGKNFTHVRGSTSESSMQEAKSFSSKDYESLVPHLLDVQGSLTRNRADSWVLIRAAHTCPSGFTPS